MRSLSLLQKVNTMVTIAPSFTRGKRGLAGQALTCIAWSPHGLSLAVAGSATVVEVWDVQAGSIRLTYTGHTDFVTSVSWSPCGRYVASGSADGTVQIWNAATGAREDAAFQPLSHAASTQVCVVAWSPDGRSLAWAGSDWTIHVWDVCTARTVQVLSDHIGAVIDLHWSHDSRHLISGGDDGLVRVWDALTLPRPLISYQAQRHRCVCAVRWSPDGKKIAFLEAGCRVQLFHVVTGMPFWCRIHGTNAALGYADEPDEEAARRGDLAFSSDGRLLASVGDDGVVWLWDVVTGTHVGELYGAPHVRALDFHPAPVSGPHGLSHLVAGSWKGTIQIWPIFLSQYQPAH